MLAQIRTQQASIQAPSKAALTPTPDSQSSSPLRYTTSTTTTTVITTTTTTTTTTETKTVPKTQPEGLLILSSSPSKTVDEELKAQGGGNVKVEEDDGIRKEDIVEEPLAVPLPPPPPLTRRNTTGSIQNASPNPNHSPKRRHPLQSRSITSRSAFPLPIQAAGFGEGSLEIASDIYKHSEKIRRQRNLKRAKQLQQRHQSLDAESDGVPNVAAAAVASTSDTEPIPAVAHPVIVPGVVASGPSVTVPEPVLLDERPLVGNLIGEDHVNYVLMYNMLTGIRIAVSRCGGKMMRPIVPEDFKAKNKYSFDIIGNELTPSAKYDFKFKDYSSFVFRHIRESVFHLDPADYLLSLTSKYILSELGSPGKSGSFFYFSRDYRFIIKTIRRSEHLFLRNVLERYWTYVRDNPQTLISRFYGLHRVKLPHGRKIHFVIMNNLFPPHKDIHATYDLKGSTVGREYPEEKAKGNPGAVLKDLNWIRRGETLDLGPEKRALLTEQLRRDKEFLKSLGVMDYSLLVGIHRMERGNRDHVRRSTLKVYSPEIPRRLNPHPHHAQDALTSMAARRAAVRSSVSEPKTMRFGREAVKLGATPGVMSSSKSARIEGENGPGCFQGHSRSQSLYHNYMGRDQQLYEVGEEQTHDGSPTSSHLYNRQRAGSGSVIGPPSSSEHSPQTVSPIDVATYHNPAYSAHPSNLLPAHRLIPSSVQPNPATNEEYEFSFLFYTDEGGLQSTNEFNEPMDRLYYLGVIDILTPYSVVKRMENLWKGMRVGRTGRNKISPVPPPEYASRFFAFMKAIMTGGEGGERFVVGNGEKGKERETMGWEDDKERVEREGEIQENGGGICPC